MSSPVSCRGPRRRATYTLGHGPVGRAAELGEIDALLEGAAAGSGGHREELTRPLPGKPGDGVRSSIWHGRRLARDSSRGQADGIVCRAGQDGCMPAKTRTRSEAPPPHAAAPDGTRPPAGRAGADPLAGFSALAREWFTGAFTEPTPAQAGAWSSIAGGDNTLVIAPTGSGKTLAAFLWALDRLARTPVPADPKLRCRVLYISPLKALAVDIERNLRAPLAGMRHVAQRRGLSEPDIRVAVRTGDTG